MFGWNRLTFNKDGTNELILLHPLRRKQFSFIVPGFSGKPRGILYLGVFDKHPGSTANHEYEFILGSMSGAGAVTFPDPSIMFPFAYISDTVDNRPAHSSSAKAGINAGDYILDVLHNPTDFSDEIDSENDWLELGRHIRPYDSNFSPLDSSAPLDTKHVHIYALKEIMVGLASDLMDSRLPSGFREGVEYMIRETPATVCGRYGISMLRH
jgi:hypothetical protein